MTPGRDGKVLLSRTGKEMWWRQCHECGAFGHNRDNCPAVPVNHIRAQDVEDEEQFEDQMSHFNAVGSGGSMSEFPDEVDPGEFYEDEDDPEN